jgi:hypothetical protein
MQILLPSVNVLVLLERISDLLRQFGGDTISPSVAKRYFDLFLSHFEGLRNVLTAAKDKIPALIAYRFP